MATENSYAMADMSKKKKDTMLTEKEGFGTAGIYSNVPQNSGFVSAPPQSGKQQVASKQPATFVYYVFATGVALIIMALVFFACTGVLFVEFNKARFETSSPTDQSPTSDSGQTSSENLLAMQMMLNSSLLDVERRLMNQFQVQHSVLNESLSLSKTNIAQQEAALTTLRRNLTQASNDQQMIEQMMTLIMEQQNHFNESISTFKDSIIFLNQTFLNLQANLTEISLENEQYDRLLEQTDQLEKELVNLNQSLLQLQGRTTEQSTTLQASVSNLDVNITRLSNTIEENQMMFEQNIEFQLQQQHSTLNESLETFENNIAEQNKTVSNLQNDITQLQQITEEQEMSFNKSLSMLEEQIKERSNLLQQKFSNLETNISQAISQVIDQVQLTNLTQNSFNQSLLNLETKLMMQNLSLHGALTNLQEQLTTSTQQNLTDFRNSTLQMVGMLIAQIQANLSFPDISIELPDGIQAEFQLVRDYIQGQSQLESIPAASCAALPLTSPSDYYWVLASNGSAVRVYCNFTGLRESTPALSCADLPLSSPIGSYWVGNVNDSTEEYCNMTGRHESIPASSCADLPLDYPVGDYWVENLTDTAVEYCNMTGRHESTPASSCANLPTSSPSDVYWIMVPNSPAMRIFCNVTGLSPSFPASSCAALPPSSPSGYYWVRASNGSAVCVYCDMTRSCGGVTGGWMRVAELDMTNTSHQCPSGLRQRPIPSMQTEPRTCVSTNTSASCSEGTSFDTIITNYTEVCGKIIGYQISGVNGFLEESKRVGIDSFYVDGVSLTYGSPREHIWTFVAAREATSTSTSQCPGAGVPANFEREPPDFVGTDYFCDTGEIGVRGLTFYADHPLWDCEDESMNCDSSSPPWFYKELPQPTTDNIEMRVCRDEAAGHEDVAVEIIEIYVK